LKSWPRPASRSKEIGSIRSRSKWVRNCPVIWKETLVVFLVRKDAITFKVDPEKLNARIALLKEELLITKFLGPKPAPQDLVRWLSTLNQELGGNKVSFCMNVGKGFIFLRSEDSNAIHTALMLSPYKSKWGTCMLQSWIPGFNPDNPNNLAFPTWVALRKLPFEHHDQALTMHCRDARGSHRHRYIE
jgi:hypothetical protein